MDAETRECIVRVLGFLPAGPEELTNEQMDLVMQECFAGEHEGPDSALGLDAETTQCIVDLVGRVPSSPTELTRDEKVLIGRECFGGQRDNRDRSRTRTVARSQSGDAKQCIVELIGRLPSGPADLSDDEKRLIGQECFHQGRPRSLSGQQSGQIRTQRPTTSSEQPAQSSDQQPSQESDVEQTTGSGVSSQESGEQLAADDQQAEALEETAANAPEPELVLTEGQRKIQELIEEHNIRIEQMEVTAVIGRLASQAGSLTKGIKVLSIVNHLVIKGKAVTDEERKDVFEQLDELDVDLD